MMKGFEPNTTYIYQDTIFCDLNISFFDKRLYPFWVSTDYL